MAGRKPTYSGILRTPPPLKSNGHPTAEEVDALFAEKIKALFVHYDIDPPSLLTGQAATASDDTAWQRLALALAIQHVPGLQPRPPQRGKRGRRPTQAPNDGMLVLAMEIFRKSYGCTREQAAEKIIASDEWGLFPKNIETLLTRYNRASGKSSKVEQAPYRDMSKKLSDMLKRLDREEIHELAMIPFEDEKP